MKKYNYLLILLLIIMSLGEFKWIGFDFYIFAFFILISISISVASNKYMYVYYSLNDDLIRSKMKYVLKLKYLMRINKIISLNEYVNNYLVNDIKHEKRKLESIDVDFDELLLHIKQKSVRSIYKEFIETQNKHKNFDLVTDKKGYYNILKNIKTNIKAKNSVLNWIYDIDSGEIYKNEYSLIGIYGIVISLFLWVKYEIDFYSFWLVYKGNVNLFITFIVLSIVLDVINLKKNVKKIVKHYEWRANIVDEFMNSLEM